VKTIKASISKSRLNGLYVMYVVIVSNVGTRPWISKSVGTKSLNLIPTEYRYDSVSVVNAKVITYMLRPTKAVIDAVAVSR